MSKFLRVDNREMMKFAEKAEDLKLGELFVQDALEQAANQYLKDVISNTPVNKDLTVPTRGSLKRQWRLDNPNVAAKVRKVSGGFMVEIVNSTYYASWVEKGHEIYNQYGGSYGWCMGQFFVRKTEVNWQSGKLDRVATLRFNKWLKDIFK